LENRRGEDDKMSREVWKAVETKAGKDRVAKAKERREKRGGGKKTEEKENGKETKKEKTERRKDDRCKESGRRIKNLGQGRGGSKVRERCEKAGPRKIS